MGTTISFGDIVRPRNFSIGVPIFEFGFMVYGSDHKTLLKLDSWINYYSPNFTYDQDIFLERLSEEELKFFGELLHKYIARGIHVDDIPLKEEYIEELREIHEGVILYISARKQGTEKQRHF